MWRLIYRCPELHGENIRFTQEVAANPITIPPPRKRCNRCRGPVVLLTIEDLTLKRVFHTPAGAREQLKAEQPAAGQ